MKTARILSGLPREGNGHDTIIFQLINSDLVISTFSLVISTKGRNLGIIQNGWFSCRRSSLRFLIGWADERGPFDHFFVLSTIFSVISTSGRNPFLPQAKRTLAPLETWISHSVRNDRSGTHPIPSSDNNHEFCMIRNLATFKGELSHIHLTSQISQDDESRGTPNENLPIGGSR